MKSFMAVQPQSGIWAKGSLQRSGVPLLQIEALKKKQTHFQGLRRLKGDSGVKTRSGKELAAPQRQSERSSTFLSFLVGFWDL